MGALEFNPDAASSDRPSDINTDGVVNINDLVQVLADFGKACP